MRNGKRNPKDYPYWKELVEMLKEKEIFIIQIGISGEESIGSDEIKFGLSLDELKELILNCDKWVSVDNFLPHFCHHLGKQGIVIWSKSNPDIFGYPENINLLKDKKYLKEKQFDIWEREEYCLEAFIEPAVVAEKILNG